MDNKKTFTVNTPIAEITYNHSDGKHLWTAKMHQCNESLLWGLTNDDYNYLMRGFNSLDDRNDDIAVALGDYVAIFALNHPASERFKTLNGADQFLLLLLSGSYHKCIRGNEDTSWVGKCDMSDDLRKWFDAYCRIVIDNGDRVFFAPIMFELAA